MHKSFLKQYVNFNKEIFYSVKDFLFKKFFFVLELCW